MFIHDATKSTTATTITEITAAPRAIVFLSVPWSGPERVARAAFLNATKQLASRPISVFLVDEDSEWCQKWLASLGASYSSPGSLGAGTTFWLQCNSVVAYAKVGGREHEIISQTNDLWGM